MRSFTKRERGSVEGTKINLYRTRPLALPAAITLYVGAVSMACLIGWALFVFLNPIVSDWHLRAVDEGAEVSRFEQAQDQYFNAYGRYASSVNDLELDPAVEFSPDPTVRYRIVVNEAGDGYIASAASPMGHYTAVVHLPDGVDLRGTGRSFEDALSNAGWAVDPMGAGFGTQPQTTSEYGSIRVGAATVTMVVQDESGSRYTGTITRIPVSGRGTTFEDAVLAAGLDPGVFTDNTASGTILSSDGRITLLVAREPSGGVAVRAEFAPDRQATSYIVDTMFADAGIDPTTVPDPNGRFACATSTSSNGVYSATLCQEVASGDLSVLASTGRGAAVGVDAVDSAFDQIGATKEWAAKAGLILPTVDDLF